MRRSLIFLKVSGKTEPEADDGQAGKIQCGIFCWWGIAQYQTRQSDGALAFDTTQNGGNALTHNERINDRIVTHMGATS
ncbi:hypothetical protein [Janthinobacterium sp. RB2P8]|uniref:hypothetical protein n=1 Tax=Janthinobacterium sp. RB2P8 TaxID=3424191 RepID=UPI003F27F577